MEQPFWKMHGAGNDFILIDDRELKFPLADIDTITHLCDRKRGIGSDGLLLIQPSDSANFRMRFVNPDASEADLCGNGARCIAQLAHEIGVAPTDMRIETGAGVLRAEIIPPFVRLELPLPKDWRMNLTIEWEEEELPLHFVNSGVPHAIVFVEDLTVVDVEALGRHIRQHALFAPFGTNANFVQTTGPASLSIRTYERGVEGETLACGTGMVAAVLVAEKLGLIQSPAQVITTGGHMLEVSTTPLSLTGPAEHSFRGTVDYR